MQHHQKFSLTQAIHYSFKTYFTNIQFFLKIIVIAIIGSAIIFFGRIFISVPLLESLIGTIVIFGWDMLLNNLLLRHYNNKEHLKIKDIFKYEGRIGSYLLYDIFISSIKIFTVLALGLIQPESFIFLVFALGIMCFNVLFFIEYFCGKYLTLDKNLPFFQSLTSAPSLVHGQKKKLLIALVKTVIVIMGSVIVFFLIPTYFLIDHVALVKYSSLILPLLWYTCFYPLICMIMISIYKQLLLNADESVINQLAHADNFNKPQSNDYL